MDYEIFMQNVVTNKMIKRMGVSHEPSRLDGLGDSKKYTIKLVGASPKLCRSAPVRK